jgi:hypothetical protein
VADVSGDLAGRQIEFDAKNEDHAAEMLRKALADFDMAKLTKVEIVGEPEIVRDGANARVRIKLRVSPDRERWKAFTGSVRTILTKTATRRAAVTDRGCPRYANLDHQVREQLDGEGALVQLFRDMDAGGERVAWEFFRVPVAFQGVIRSALAGQDYRLAYTLLDEQGTEVLRTTSDILDAPAGHLPWHTRPLIGDPGDPVIGPGWFSTCATYVLEMEHTISLSRDDLKRVTKTVVFLEKDTKQGGSPRERRPSPGSDRGPREKSTRKRGE